MHRGQCLGSCPAYSLRVYSGRRVEFEGEAFTVAKGLCTARLEPSQMEALARAIAESGFFALSEDCCDCVDRTCAPNVILEVRDADRSHRIIHYLGCDAAPERLHDLEQQVDIIVGTDKWIGTRETRMKADLVRPDIDNPVLSSAPVTSGNPRQTMEAIPLWQSLQAEATRVLNPVFFDYDHTSVRQADLPVLVGVSAFLKVHPEVKLSVEGHTDERGTALYCDFIGRRRALAVAAWLEGAGIDPDRLEIISYGKEKPLDPDANEAAWAQNRRVEFRLILAR